MEKTIVKQSNGNISDLDDSARAHIKKAEDFAPFQYSDDF
jgi:hypothetical protein